MRWGPQENSKTEADPQNIVTSFATQADEQME
jgi:hypothetical protein